MSEVEIDPRRQPPKCTAVDDAGNITIIRSSKGQMQGAPGKKKSTKTKGGPGGPPPQCSGPENHIAAGYSSHSHPK